MTMRGVWVGCVFAGLIGVSGCEPAPPTDLGTVVTEAPKIPNSEEYTKLPELGPAPPDESPSGPPPLPEGTPLPMTPVK